MRRKRKAMVVGLALGAVVLSACGGSGDYSSSDESTSAGAPLPPPAEGPYDAVYFDNPGVNPFVPTAEDWLSTFALDVDTGSYTVGRRFLDDGNLPDPDSVRTEEYINYFDPGYADPEANALGIEIDGGRTPFVQGEDHRLVRVGVQSRHITEQERLDSSLTFVIDTSGSMDQENRLELVKDSLQMLVENLRPEESIAIVTYGSEARVVLPPTPVAESGAIIEAIEGLAPEGSTNAEAGLQLGYEQARAGFREGGINRVVLASDGVANVGATGPDGILASVGAQARDGIHLVTLGFGMGNYNDTMMEQLANQGDGFYSYIDTIDEAERLFTQDLVSTLQTLADESKIQVEWNPAAVSEYRLIGFENRDIVDTDFRNELSGVEAGEIGAGHSVTALYEVTLAPPGTNVPAADAPATSSAESEALAQAPTGPSCEQVEDGAACEDDAPVVTQPRTPMEPGTLGTVTLRWTDPTTGEVEEQSIAVGLADVQTDFEEAAPRFRLAVAAAAFAEVLRSSPHAEQYDLDDVREVAGDVADELSDDPEVIEFRDLVARATELD